MSTEEIIAALEEALARKLVEALPNLYAKTGRPEGRSLNTCASECLRQMEWARRECVTCRNDHPTVQVMVTPTGHKIDNPLAIRGEVAVELVEIPLTLAPPDWQP